MISTISSSQSVASVIAKVVCFLQSSIDIADHIAQRQQSNKELHFAIQVGDCVNDKRGIPIWPNQIDPDNPKGGKPNEGF